MTQAAEINEMISLYLSLTVTPPLTSASSLSRSFLRFIPDIAPIRDFLFQLVDTRLVTEKEASRAVNMSMLNPRAIKRDD